MLSTGLNEPFVAGGTYSVRNTPDTVPQKETQMMLSQTTTPAIQVKQLVKRRSQGEFEFTLKVPSIEVHHGEFVAIVGESGCGKSTLLDMLGLLLKPSQAHAFLLRDPSDPSRILDVLALGDRQHSLIRRQLIGYVLQTGGLLPYLKVRDNILLTPRINGDRQAYAFVRSMCERLKIAEQFNKYPAHLSGGQRQRVAIARALAHKPPFILADEPTAAVDKITAREIRNTFKELSSEMGVTVFMVTHDLELVRDVADRTFTFELERTSPTTAVSSCIEQRAQTTGGMHG